MRKRKRLLLVGGGTGGHIVPNLAIATELQRDRVALQYIGSYNRLDRELVTRAGLPFKAIFSGKFRRYASWRHLLDPFLFVLGFFQSLYLILCFRPDAIYSTGGYVSLPVMLAGYVLRYPMILQESDSAMGLANRLAARMARRIVLAYPDASRSPKAIHLGNPVRPSVPRGAARGGWKLTGLTPKKPVALVMGGSLGAQKLNELVVKGFPRIASRLQVIHITGAGKETSFSARGYVQFPYLGDRFPDLYAIADLVVARSGANTLAELALLKKPSILIPLPGSAQGNQQGNAAYFESRGAAIVLNQEGLTSRKLMDTLLVLSDDKARQRRMRQALARLARPDAARQIAQLILDL